MALIKKFRIKSFKEQEAILHLNKISMFYNKRQILNNLSLKINKQEVLGMLGPNGVGKSTIFHIIARISLSMKEQLDLRLVMCRNMGVLYRI